MRKFFPFLFIFIFSLWGENKCLKIKENERIIIFAPHPDDEILGCAGLIQKVLKKKGKVWIVYLTNGDHNQLVYRVYEKKIVLKPSDYIKLGKMRRKESIKATGFLGVLPTHLIFLGYPDFGTLKIWENYWGDETKPYKSFLTRARYVPYEENYSYGKPYIGDSILNDIEEIIKRIKPTKIFTTGSYDRNVDHRALYNFLRVSLLDVKKEINPDVYIYLIHFGKWPLSDRYTSYSDLSPPESLKKLEWYVLPLEKHEVEKKYNSIKIFKSQVFLKKEWFFSFARSNEIFYKDMNNNLKEGDILSFESEKDAEFKDIENISIPYKIFIRGEKNDIEIGLFQKRRFLKPMNYIFYFYGWRDDIPFPDMPKIKISLRKKREILKIENSTVYYSLKYKKEKNMISFKIKWAKIGNPEYLFFSAEVKTGGITYDFIPWRLIKVNYKF